MGLISALRLENDHFTFNFRERVDGQEVLGLKRLDPDFLHQLEITIRWNLIFEVSIFGYTGEPACDDAATLLASLRSQILLDTFIVTKFLLRVLVSICTFLSHAISFL